MQNWQAQIGYLVAAVCFIIALRMMNSPATARRGNWLAAFGMGVALAVTVVWVWQEQSAEGGSPADFRWVALGIAVGTVVGVVSAKRVQMTAMPQMVALFNGVGGGAVALVALMEFMSAASHGVGLTLVGLITSVLSAAIGSISFSGSLIAFGKLQELMPGRPITYPGQKAINLLLFAGMLALIVLAIGTTPTILLFTVLIGVALLLGVLMVLPIGGADMPVVISLLNSFTGLAAGLAGFVLDNSALLIGGALVGASGLILTLLMCSAMNRSLEHVLFGAFGAVSEATGGAVGASKVVKSYTVEDAAIICSNANSVIIVPGYGMAVAQAQHAVKEFAQKLMNRGVEVKYAIHPVAGRMPGHMNVLLAEADVPYDQLFDLIEINPLFPETDVALVIGANDVVNPAARYDKTSPIYGMPILDVDKARTVIVLKRSMGAGFAGIDNELFTADNTIMVFGDAKSTMTKLVGAMDVM